MLGNINTLLVKQQFVVVHRHTVLQQTETKKKTWLILNRPTFKHVMFLLKEDINASSLFCRHSILTEGMFETEVSSNAKISVLRILWVTKNCRFMTDQTFYTREPLLHKNYNPLMLDYFIKMVLCCGITPTKQKTKKKTQFRH